MTLRRNTHPTPSIGERHGEIDPSPCPMALTSGNSLPDLVFSGYIGAEEILIAVETEANENFKHGELEFSRGIGDPFHATEVKVAGDKKRQHHRRC